MIIYKLMHYYIINMIIYLNDNLHYYAINMIICSLSVLASVKLLHYYVITFMAEIELHLMNARTSSILARTHNFLMVLIVANSK